MRARREIREAAAWSRAARLGWLGVRLRTHPAGACHAARVDSEDRPVPACDVGVGGWDAARMLPSLDDVDCGRCLKLRAPVDAPPNTRDGTPIPLAL